MKGKILASISHVMSCYFLVRFDSDSSPASLRISCVHHVFEFLDLVAEQRGFFKFQILGGLEHFGLEFWIVE